MLLGVLYLEGKSPRETIRVIEEATSFEKNIISSLILSDAYREDNNEVKSQKIIKNAAQQVKRALFNFKCCACGKTFGKWTDNCSTCNTFDSLEYFPEVNI